ncbi:MAG: phosphate ABC transporter ATP-binding protein [Spirochaetales bacterium]|nr:phosphate ABC transporter ATP-binding protein [Leptospiraceae bacterium]MCP5483239.1 phosphate ABC transporter ATP-binding protein [Spirochaetales bacterium]MCP5486808.1 phosphate ABC transporter ATP-binding protein [Spirochaetales bacterium]
MSEEQKPGVKVEHRGVADDEGPETAPVVFDCRNVDIYYGEFKAVENLSMPIYQNRVTALIGPSGCGKSTFLRTLNRMNDFIPDWSCSGELRLNGDDIYAKGIDPVEIRLRVGMVFQSPNPFPKSIYENISLGPRLNGYTGNVDELVESALRKAYLWEEVRDKLKESATSLSGGQQQRLCIARAIAMLPEVLLMDEPTASLDPISTRKIEELITELKEHYTIIIVTHNMQQAARVGDYTALFYQGKLIEYDRTFKIFTNPSEKLTEDYITGRFG